LLTADDNRSGSQHACTGCGLLTQVPDTTRVGKHTDIPGRQPPPRLEVVGGRQMIFWMCPHCRTNLEASLENVGQFVSCSGCDKPVSVPNPLTSSTRSGTSSADQFNEVSPGQPARRKKMAGLAGALVLAVLAIAGVVVALAILKPWASKSPSLSEEQLQFLPDDAEFVAHLDVQQLLASAAYRKADKLVLEFTGERLQTRENQLRDEFGLGWSELTSVTTGGKLGDLRSTVVVVRTRVVVSADGLLLKNNRRIYFDREKVGRFTMYQTKKALGRDRAFAFCVADEQTIVISPRAGLLRTILERDHPARLSADLDAAINQADFSGTFALATGKLPPHIIEQARTLEVWHRGAHDLPKKVTGVTLEIDAGETVSINMVILCEDAQAARDINQAARDIRETARSVLKRVNAFRKSPEAQELLNSFRFSTKDTRVIATVSVDPDKVARILHQADAFRRMLEMP
jgi:hypothetical protein